VNSAPPPAARLVRATARQLLARENARLPDLSGVTILLPHLRSAPELVRELGQAANAPALLLPRITTLKDWAENTPTALEILPDSRREAMLYQVLRDGNWFPETDLWQISAELRQLADELTRWKVSLPDSWDDFADRLTRAYRARANASLRFEARLVHEMWFALARDSGGPDGESAYALCLAALAEAAPGPLYAVGLEDLSPAEEAFLDAYARRQPVHRIAAPEPDPVSRTLRAAWPLGDAPPLRQRAAGAGTVSLADRITLFGAHSLEQEAQAVDVKVRQWLVAGKAPIAIVAQDRLVARRARALLERAGVLVEDETGWTLSTSSASTVVRRWLDCLASRFYHLDLLDLLKSPFLLTDWEPARRKEAVYGLERLLRERSIVSHLNRYLEAARRREGLDDAVALLERLADAQALFTRRARTLSAWLQTLLESLALLGIQPGLEKDVAGRQLLQLLKRQQRELSRETTTFALSEWKQWLYRLLDGATFRDERIASPVVFTHLANARLRAFAGAIIAGADAAHLPGQDTGPLFFNQSVREELGLPSRATALARQERELIDVLADCGEVFVTWQARKDNEPNLLSPWFERLEAFHRLAYGAGLRDEGFAAVIAAVQIKDETLNPGGGFSPASPIPHHASMPSPSLPESLVPTTVSASGYNSLLACPYQFYARHGLRLNELDEVRESLEKRDYGEYIHQILCRFHETHPAISGCDDSQLQAELAALTDEVFATATEASYLSHAWALRWKALIPAYLDWQRQREGDGWRVKENEVQRSRDIPLPGGGSLTLKGRLDRVDDNGDTFAVLDYKAQGVKKLQNKLKEPGEDVQLPVYALLYGDETHEAAFVSLDKEGVASIPLEQDAAELGAAVETRLAELFDSLRQGAGLPAQGQAEVCEWCEMRGLCRKDHWNE
jgi:ATP-dependent helicase/nuclease subunit B